MTADGLLVLEAVFGMIWQFFTSWHIPGTETTPAAAFLFILVSGVALRFLKALLAPGLASVDPKVFASKKSSETGLSNYVEGGNV